MAPVGDDSRGTVGAGGAGPARAVLCCAGQGHRWGNYLGVPKHLVPIDGVPLIERSVGQLNARGIDDVVITSSDRRYDIAGARRCTPDATILPGTGMGFSTAFWSDSARTLVLLGDVCFSDAAMDALVGASAEETTWLGRRGRGQIKPYGEIFGVCIARHHQQRLREAAVTVIELRRRGLVRRTTGWELYAVVNGLDPTVVNPGPHWLDIDDETDDFDFPGDYRAWIRRYRAQELATLRRSAWVRPWSRWSRV
jgi:molybdopterin-guanine dinucleotide biosynthesis protein A